jgi:hypothetical protein
MTDLKPQAKKAVAASGMSRRVENHAPEVATAPLGAARAIPERDDGNAGRSRFLCRLHKRARALYAR